MKNRHIEELDTVEKLLKFLNEIIVKKQDFKDASNELYDVLDVWRDALMANSGDPWIFVDPKQMMARYNTLLKLFGLDIHQDLQQFFDDNKDKL